MSNKKWKMREIFVGFSEYLNFIFEYSASSYYVLPLSIKIFSDIDKLNNSINFLQPGFRLGF